MSEHRQAEILRELKSLGAQRATFKDGLITEVVFADPPLPEIEEIEEDNVDFLHVGGEGPPGEDLWAKASEEMQKALDKPRDDT